MKPMTKKQIKDIRQRLDVTRRLTDAAIHPDAGADLVVMCAAAQAWLALDAVPMLLDEICRLQAKDASPATTFVKFDHRGGSA